MDNWFEHFLHVLTNGAFKAHGGWIFSTKKLLDYVDSYQHEKRKRKIDNLLKYYEIELMKKEILELKNIIKDKLPS